MAMATPNTANDARMAQQLQNQEYNAAQAQYEYSGQNLYGQPQAGQPVVHGTPVYPGQQAPPVYPGQYTGSAPVGVPVYQQAQISPRWVPFVSTRAVRVSPEHLHLCQVVYRSNTVKLLAFLDWIFLFLAHWTPAVALLSLMPLCGYYGARTFNKCCTWTYTLYLLLQAAGRFALFLLYVQEGSDGAVILLFVSLLALFIFSFVFKFARDVNRLSPEQRALCLQIRDGTYGYNSML